MPTVSLSLSAARRYRRALLISLAALLLSLPQHASAQQSSASITGIVTDASGAVVADARVDLLDVATGVTRNAVTNNAGSYVFIDVIPAAYTMKVAKQGFSTLAQPQFTLEVNQTATLNFTLTVGSTTQTLTVEGTAVAIEASTAELGTVINEQSVNQLPLNGRNFTQLLTLTPGASPVSVGQNSGGGGGFAGNAIGSFSFPALNGQRNRSNMFLLDGINDLGSFIGNYNFEPIVDTVQEFKVQSHNDESQFGQALGGVVNVVTKSGNNDFHGSLWEFLRNSDFDARNFFLPSVNPLRQNQFGLAGGGPVWIPKVYNGRNHTFFYGGWEQYRQSQATQNAILVPTTAELNGDFSGVSNQLYNPFSTAPDPAHPGSYTRTPFAGNQISSGLIDPAAALYLKTLYPAAGALVNGSNAYDTTPAIVQQNSYNGRIDQIFSEHDVLFGRISYYDQNDANSAGLPTARNAVIISGWNLAIHETHTFSPSAILDVHFGRNTGDDLQERLFPAAPTNFATQLEQLGFSTNFIGQFQGGQGPFVPLIGVSGYAGLGGNNVQDTRIADIWQFGGDFTKIHGRHTFTFGADFATNNTRSPIYGADVGFASTQTQNPESANGTGNALASFLLGVPDNAGKRNVLETEHGGWVDGAYAQDQWKVTDRLTINLGIRWDVTLWPIYGTPNTPDQYVGDLNLNNGTYILAAVPPACSPTLGFPCIPGGTLPAHVVPTPFSNHAIYHNDYRDWQGRAGLAYRLTDKTAVRMGYGRFYDNWNAVIQLAQNYEGNWPDVGQLLANNLNQPGGTAARIGDPFNLGSGGVVYPAPTPFNQVNWMMDPTAYRMPYSDQWNVGVEQQLGQNTVLSLAYVGAHDLQLNLGGYKNTAVTPGPGDAATVASRQPYPYIHPTYYDQSIGQSKYNAFQFSLQQKSTHGLTYLISYTRSKSIDVGCSGSFGSEGCEIQNAYNLNGDRSVSGFDLPNIFSGSVVWDVPFGKGKTFSTGHGAVDYILGNWQLAGIVSFYSGLPFDVTFSNGNQANTGNVTERANLVLQNPYAANQGPNLWLNPAAFAAPPLYTFGTLGRNSLRSDASKNLDLSLMRDFPVKEHSYFEFRADSFNLTNTPIFNIPNNVLGNPNLGVVTSTANTPRELQLALKFIF
ncbi:MAG: carboxypeptidase regulatory-like domain-containing protein [Acidobacteriota bacterium]|nr:carboxypeptidase regulatory-like domain-containing protein [Acidobacteriota bacterium]